MKELSVEQMRRLRGQVLEMVYVNHRKQEHRLSHVVLWGALTEKQWDLGYDDVLGVLQDLGDRGYLKFVEQRDRKTSHVSIDRIQITPAGRDLVEGTTVDPAVFTV